MVQTTHTCWLYQYYTIFSDLWSTLSLFEIALFLALFIQLQVLAEWRFLSYLQSLWWRFWYKTARLSGRPNQIWRKHKNDCILNMKPKREKIILPWSNASTFFLFRKKDHEEKVPKIDEKSRKIVICYIVSIIDLFQNHVNKRQTRIDITKKVVPFSTEKSATWQVNAYFDAWVRGPLQIAFAFFLLEFRDWYSKFWIRKNGQNYRCYFKV